MRQMKIDALKIATWNVNSLKVRLPQVLDWLHDSQTDVLCLQELKLAQEHFPQDAFAQAGYAACWAGQKTYNGVAVVARAALLDASPSATSALDDSTIQSTIQRNIPGFEDPQQRAIAVTLPGGDGRNLRIISVYCPNGQALDSDKYPYKLAWFAALRNWLAQELRQHPRLLVLGDYNVAPQDADVHDPSRWAGNVLVSAPERQAFDALLALGLHDAFRLFGQPPDTFSWWDYRQAGFRRNAGLRIDHILVSDALKPLCQSCVVDKTPRGWPQPSDHAPVVASFDLTPLAT